MVKSISDLKEGDVFNGIMLRRFYKNQNTLAAIVGKTGSGKSWACLRIAEIWYNKFFHRQFPMENCCFTVESLMERLVHGKLEDGEILILEEAGVNLGSLDFQSKLAKTFNYVLQSFRSRRITVFVNLPFFSMLNKQARMLLHFYMQTIGVDKAKEKSNVKIFFLSYSQDKGKLYRHRPKIIINGINYPIDMLSYSKPSQELIDKYEQEKIIFVRELSNDVLQGIKNNKKPLTELQEKIDGCFKEGIFNHREIAEKLGKPRPLITVNIGYMRSKGVCKENYMEKLALGGINTNPKGALLVSDG